MLNNQYLKRKQIELLKQKIHEQEIKNAFKLRFYQNKVKRKKPKKSIIKTEPILACTSLNVPHQVQILQHTFSKLKKTINWFRQIKKINGFSEISHLFTYVKKNPNSTLMEAYGKFHNFQKAQIQNQVLKSISQFQRNLLDAIQQRQMIQINRMIKGIKEEIEHIVKHKYEFVRRRQKKLSLQNLRQEKKKFIKTMFGKKIEQYNYCGEVDVDGQIKKLERTTGLFEQVMPFSRMKNKELKKAGQEVASSLKRLYEYLQD